MTYCVLIWGNTYKTTLDSSIKLQKRAVRIINKVGFRQPTTCLFIQSTVLRFHDIVRLRIVEIMSRIVNKNIVVVLFRLREGIYH